MADGKFLRLGGASAEQFLARLVELGIELPFDRQVPAGTDAPLAQPMRADGLTVGNRWCIHAMEGWDCHTDGRPSELTIRRWRNFGRSGAKLIWGGEAAAVLPEGRANPNQLMAAEHTKADLAALRETLVAEHRAATGSADGLIVGLQLTHSGRWCRPNVKTRPEPRTLYRHPLLDGRVGITDDSAVLSDGDIRRIIDAFGQAGRIAADAGFDFVDVKHCHGYLGHEFLSAHTRPGAYGGDFANRTRFLREVVQAVRSAASGLRIGVRFSAFDSVPYRPDPAQSTPQQKGPGVPESYQHLLPYRWGFGCNPNDPTAIDLDEPRKFLALLAELGVKLVNLTAGSPYYNPHIQRPFCYAPSDAYQTPEDPLVGVARQLAAAGALKATAPAGMLLVGTGYTYLQEFLPNVASAAVRDGWIDSVGIGRMVLSYPELPADVLAGRPVQKRRICRTFSDCTTAPRNGLPSGCYPLDEQYRVSQWAGKLKEIKTNDK